ncbi:hypothetical protein [Mesorhizobium xinjiangense]|uniref:hypothetical protein n=1 Tax=Mesorhizobium xinjiangense TaxID=2678685 RepID=UPI0012ED9B48|nr:hypothetical protein [Mesorhizobium xinjiangense]
MARLIVNRTLALLVAAYWSVFFALLALGATAAPGRGSVRAELALSPADQVGIAAAALGPFGPAILASACAIVCALFAWAFLTILLDCEKRAVGPLNVMRQAVCAALALLMATSLLGAFGEGGGVLLAHCLLQILALLACHFAAQFELRRGGFTRRAADKSEDAARLLAVGAAHDSLLNRLWKAETRSGKVL